MQAIFSHAHHVGHYCTLFPPLRDSHSEPETILHLHFNLMSAGSRCSRRTQPGPFSKVPTGIFPAEWPLYGSPAPASRGRSVRLGIPQFADTGPSTDVRLTSLHEPSTSPEYLYLTPLRLEGEGSVIFPLSW